MYYDLGRGGKGWSKVSWARLDMGADAYLCCPGPSLQPIQRGRGRKVFAINTAYPRVHPDIWMGLDRVECYDRQIWGEPFIKVCRGNYGDMEVDGRPIKYFDNVFFASIAKLEGSMFDYINHEDPLVWHKNTLATMLHLIIKMGAKTIHLAGCDMGGNDYYDERVLSDKHRAINHKLYKEQIGFIRDISKRIKIISVTPNSPLNEFLEYKELDQALKRSEEKVKVNDGPILHCLDAEENYKKVTVATMYKSGGDYTLEYVHRLHASVKEYLPKVRFVCVSDVKIDGVETIPIKYDLGDLKAPHWCKLEIYEHFKEGKTLFIDLSVVVKKDLSPFTTYSGFTMVRDFINPKYMNSCVMSWDGDYSYILKKFLKDPAYYRTLYYPRTFNPWNSGFEQKFTEDTVGNVNAFDDGMVVSYKIGTREQIDNSIIVKFHGKPRPHDVGWKIHRPKPRWEVLEKLIKDNNMTNVAELGTWWGKTFSYLLKNCPNTNVLSVDQFKVKNKTDELGYETYEGWEMDKFRNHAQEIANSYKDRARLLVMDTVEASKHIDDNSLDLVFIDAGHSERELRNDIYNWLPKLKKDGYLTGHDIDWESVKKVVDIECKGYTIDDDNTWYIKKDMMEIKNGNTHTVS
jgi:predicted O-methyltransferase YrrM